MWRLSVCLVFGCFGGVGKFCQMVDRKVLLVFCYWVILIWMCFLFSLLMLVLGILVIIVICEGIVYLLMLFCLMKGLRCFFRLWVFSCWFLCIISRVNGCLFYCGLGILIIVILCIVGWWLIRFFSFREDSYLLLVLIMFLMWLWILMKFMLFRVVMLLVCIQLLCYNFLLCLGLWKYFWVSYGECNISLFWDLLLVGRKWFCLFMIVVFISGIGMLVLIWQVVCLFLFLVSSLLLRQVQEISGQVFDMLQVVVSWMLCVLVVLQSEWFSVFLLMIIFQFLKFMFWVVLVFIIICRMVGMQWEKVIFLCFYSLISSFGL